MRKIIVVSDIHINAYGSERNKFIKFLNLLECDLLIINGDLFDLYLGGEFKYYSGEPMPNLEKTIAERNYTNNPGTDIRGE